MKTNPTPILLASLLACSVLAQDRPPEGNAAPRAMGGMGGERRAGGRMAPMERIMGGGDVEQNMLLRLLDNPRLSEELKLTEEQRTALKTVMEDFDKQLEEYRPKLEEAIKVQTGLLGELKPDEAKLMEAVEAAWKIRTEVAKIQTRKLLALRSRLTVEQINRAKEMMDSARERMQGFRNREEGGFRGRGEGARGEGGLRGGPRGDRPAGGEGRPARERPETAPDAL